MHDIKFIRDHPEAFDAGLARRGLGASSHWILSDDANIRNVQTRQQEWLAKRNSVSKNIGKAKAAGNTELASDLLAQAEELKTLMSGAEGQADTLKMRLHDALSSLPNLPADDVPVGKDEGGNVEESRWGSVRSFDFAPKEHADLGPALGLDFETGALISGARFTFLRGQMARLARAIGQFMLDHQTSVNGYIECNPPVLVRDEAMYGTDKLPKFAEDSFATYLAADRTDFIREKMQAYNASNFELKENQESLQNLAESMWEKLPTKTERRWLIPTAEVSLTSSVMGQIVDDAILPLRMTALTLCFRSEAGAAGKDTRGYIRQHQFEKCELVSVTRPEDSEAEHERMAAAAESILEALNLPYRKVLLCTGDMGFGARKTYDLEVWLPGQNAYREISSISNCGDFQARRMNTRYRPDGAKGTEFVHTLNGSGLAVGRTLVAVLENYQQADGSVTVPDALLPYMGGITALVQP